MLVELEIAYLAAVLLAIDPDIEESVSHGADSGAARVLVSS